jgi:peptidoglycan/LPS O-acetylase OafA/YrhL
MKIIVKIIITSFLFVFLFVTGMLLAFYNGNYFPIPIFLINFLGVAVFACSIFVLKNVKLKEN